MPGLGKYGTTEDTTSSEKRRERYLRHFRNSPVYDGSYVHERMIEIANTYMLESDPTDEDIDFNYTRAPSWSDVKDAIDDKKGAGGSPTTPWTPNQASPTGQRSDHTTIPEYDVDPEDISVSFVEGIDGTVDPKKTSKDISSTRLGDILLKGKRPISK